MQQARHSLLTALPLLLLAALPHTAQAQTLIYDNGTFVTTNALNFSDYAIADDFVFSSPQTFDQMRVWVMNGNIFNNTLSDFSGTLSWLIRSNNAGIPGGVLFSGTVSGAEITQTDTGVDAFSTRVFQLDFGIPSQTLGEGRYWFQIKENGLSDSSDGTALFWLDSGSATGFDSQVDNNPVSPTTWNSRGTNSTNRAFQFLAASSASAPEPGTLALLSLGGTLVIVQRRRRKKEARVLAGSLENMGDADLTEI